MPKIKQVEITSVLLGSACADGVKKLSGTASHVVLKLKDEIGMRNADVKRMTLDEFCEFFNGAHGFKQDKRNPDQVLRILAGFQDESCCWISIDRVEWDDGNAGKSLW